MDKKDEFKTGPVKLPDYSTNIRKGSNSVNIAVTDAECKVDFSVNVKTIKDLLEFQQVLDTAIDNILSNIYENEMCCECHECNCEC